LLSSSAPLCCPAEFSVAKPKRRVSPIGPGVIFRQGNLLDGIAASLERARKHVSQLLEIKTQPQRISVARPAAALSDLAYDPGKQPAHLRLGIGQQRFGRRQVGDCGGIGHQTAQLVGGGVRHEGFRHTQPQQLG
jgi:hypothetical protein